MTAVGAISTGAPMDITALGTSLAKGIINQGADITSIGTAAQAFCEGTNIPTTGLYLLTGFVQVQATKADGIFVVQLQVAGSTALQMVTTARQLNSTTQYPTTVQGFVIVSCTAGNALRFLGSRTASSGGTMKNGVLTYQQLQA